MNKYSDGTVSSSVQSDEVALGIGARQWQFAYREAVGPHIIGTVLISITLVLATFTLTSPMGTDDLDWMQRLAYFSASTFLCAPLCYAKYIVVLYVTRFWPPVQITLAVAVGTLMASLPSTTIVYAVDTLIRADVPSYSLPKMYLVVASSMLLCSSVTHYMVGQRLKSGTAASPSTAPADEHKQSGSAGGGAFSSAAVDRAVSNAVDRPVMELPSKFPRPPAPGGRPGHHLSQNERPLRGSRHHRGSLHHFDAPDRCRRRVGRSGGSCTPLLLGCLCSRRRLDQTQPTHVVATHRRQHRSGKPHLP